MLFIGQMVGFITAGVANGHLVRKYGLGKVIAWGAGVQLVGYTFLVPAFPFPVMPCAYAVVGKIVFTGFWSRLAADGQTGFGIALQDAAANTFVATLPNAEFVRQILCLGRLSSHTTRNLASCTPPMDWARSSALWHRPPSPAPGSSSHTSTAFPLDSR